MPANRGHPGGERRNLAIGRAGPRLFNAGAHDIAKGCARDAMAEMGGKRRLLERRGRAGQRAFKIEPVGAETARTSHPEDDNLAGGATPPRQPAVGSRLRRLGLAWAALPSRQGGGSARRLEKCDLPDGVSWYIKCSFDSKIGRLRPWQRNRSRRAHPRLSSMPSRKRWSLIQRRLLIAWRSRDSWAEAQRTEKSGFM